MDILLRVLGNKWENGWVKTRKDKWSIENYIEDSKFLHSRLGCRAWSKAPQGCCADKKDVLPLECRERCPGKCERNIRTLPGRGDWVESLEGIWECSSWVNLEFYRLITSSKYFRKQGKTSVSYCSHFAVLAALFEMEMQAGMWLHCG